jgi:3-oxoacyl-[acyl-carrier protein] reductase
LAFRSTLLACVRLKRSAWTHSRLNKNTPQPGRLQDRCALVTGAGRGLGVHIARALASEGANVIIHFHTSSDGARAVAEEVRAMGRDAAIVQADVTSWEQVRRLADEAFAAFGRLDVLVNNVGDVAPDQMSWRDLTEPVLDRVLAVDIKGTLLVTHEVGQRMVAAGGGAIVNVSSNVVVTGSARAPQYAASKYGVLGITKSYAHAFAPSVRVNALGPGFIEVESTLTRRDWTPERRQSIVDRTPLNRIARPEQVTGVVVFLASDDSQHMTGSFLVCDGGFSMVGA